MDKKAMRSHLLLLLTALIWGAGYVAQRLGLNHLGSFAFNGLRSLVGAAAVMPVALMSWRRDENASRERNPLIKGGLLCGLVLCAASNLQQAGLVYTSVGKAGFISALYILFVPLIGLAFGRKVTKLFVVAVAIAMAGMFMLTMEGAESVSKGDLLVLGATIMFAVHIMIIDHYSPMVNGSMMAMIQFGVSGTLSVIIAHLVGERITLDAVHGALMPMLYSGVCSCGIGYTLQIIAQKDVNPVVASLVLSLEAVFAALAGWALLGESLTGRELTGCALVFSAVILAQLPDKKLAPATT